MWCLAKNAQKLLKNDDRKCSCVPQCIDCNYKEMIIEEQEKSSVQSTWLYKVLCPASADQVHQGDRVPLPGPS
ncbi:hypothetical protein HF086_007788, partial [Spodoptera exigua]